MNTLNRTALSGMLAVAALCGLTPGVAAQQINQPWTFSPQNRASIAVTLKQMKDGNGGGGGSAGSASLTTIVCGGGSATATANNTCIILNNATGAIETGQDSEGDQEATSSAQTTVNGDQSEADEVLSTLAGN